MIIATGCMFLALLVLPAVPAQEYLEPVTYNCPNHNPCTGTTGDAYFPHDNQAKFIQCWWGNCYEMPCPAGLVWYQNVQRCDWVGTNLPPSDIRQCSCAIANPCNIGTAGYFSCKEPTKFGQCDRNGRCAIQLCPSGPPQQVWDATYKTCKLPTSGNGQPST